MGSRQHCFHGFGEINALFSWIKRAQTPSWAGLNKVETSMIGSKNCVILSSLLTLISGNVINYSKCPLCVTTLIYWIYLGDMCINNLHLGRHINGYTVGNVVLDEFSITINAKVIILAS